METSRRMAPSVSHGFVGARLEIVQSDILVRGMGVVRSSEAWPAINDRCLIWARLESALHGLYRSVIRVVIFAVGRVESVANATRSNKM